MAVRRAWQARGSIDTGDGQVQAQPTHGYHVKRYRLSRKGAVEMAFCHEMKMGQVYVCEECGLEIQVVKECEECGEDDTECSLEECRFMCCGEDMKLKESA
jgi:hypothetical protein